MSLLETASLHSNPEDAGDSTQLFELRSGKTGGSSPYSSMKARRSRRRKRNPWDLPPSDDEDELDPMNADEDDSYFHDSEMDSDAELLDVGSLQPAPQFFLICVFSPVLCNHLFFSHFFISRQF